MGSRTAVKQLVAVLRPGEESQQLGDDAAFVFRFKKAMRQEPLAASVLDSLRPLAKAHGLDMEELEFIIEMRVPTLRATLEREGIASFSMDCAVAIYLYTIDQPKIYKFVNTACHAPDRDVGPGGLSPSLRACMPYIKFLDTSLERLPPKYLFKGRLNRGVKWAYPTPEAHNPEAHFPKGKRFFWYEFKSAAREFNVMYQESFCGESGPRTIFTIDACDSYMIEPFSHYPQEAEALFRPLAQFEVTSTQKRLRAQDLLPDAPKGGFPDEVHLKQMVKPGGVQAQPQPGTWDKLRTTPHADEVKWLIPEPEPEPEVDLPTQLKAMSVRQLQAHAAEEGCTPKQIDDARLDDTPKVALMDLVAKQAAANMVEEKKRQKATAKLQKRLGRMVVKELVLLAQAIPSIDGVALETALESDEPKPVLVQLLMDAEDQVRHEESSPAVQRRVAWREAKRWRALLAGGMVIQHAGWWSFYGDLGWVLGLLGGALAFCGALGFFRNVFCGASGSAVDALNMGLYTVGRLQAHGHTGPKLRAMVNDGLVKGALKEIKWMDSWEGFFVTLLVFYAFAALWANHFSALCASSTEPILNTPWRKASCGNVLLCTVFSFLIALFVVYVGTFTALRTTIEEWEDANIAETAAAPESDDLEQEQHVKCYEIRAYKWMGTDCCFDEFHYEFLDDDAQKQVGTFYCGQPDDDFTPVLDEFRRRAKHFRVQNMDDARYKLFLLFAVEPRVSAPDMNRSS